MSLALLQMCFYKAFVDLAPVLPSGELLRIYSSSIRAAFTWSTLTDCGENDVTYNTIRKCMPPDKGCATATVNMRKKIWWNSAVWLVSCCERTDRQTHINPHYSTLRASGNKVIKQTVASEKNRFCYFLFGSDVLGRYRNVRKANVEEI